MYRYQSHLSLDVAVGAILLSSAVAKYFNGILAWNTSISLGIAVWIIYTFDHLIDAKRSSQTPNISRHLFHKLHSKKLYRILPFAVIAGVMMVLTIPRETIWMGLVLLGVVFAYFLFIYFFKGFYLKEIFVAMVYATGVFLGPISVYDTGWDFTIFNFFIQLLAIAFLNLLLFSYMEYDLDEKDRHPSISRKIGKRATSLLFKTITILLILWQIFYLINTNFDSFQLLFLVMAAVLLLIFMNQETLIKNETYRWLGDAVFFIPAIEIWL